MQTSSAKKTVVRIRLLQGLLLVPCLLSAACSLFAGIYCLQSGRELLLPCVFLFVLSLLLLILLLFLLRSSSRVLTRLLRSCGFLGQQQSISLPELLLPEVQRQLLHSAQDYSGRIDELQLLRSQAEYNAHQSQINPHFLYNTLDTIRGKALEHQQEEIAAMIESLSRIFRYSISNRSDLLNLKDELKNVKDYINIQQTRFANRFSFSYQVDETDWRLLYFRVPKLILQPLVENAILHGLDTMVSGGVVRLSAFRTESYVVLRVEDNGCGIPAPQLKTMCTALQENQPGGATGVGGGIAIGNINRRIRHIYGQEYGLSLSSTVGLGTAVEIVMPYTEV